MMNEEYFLEAVARIVKRATNNGRLLTTQLMLIQLFKTEFSNYNLDEKFGEICLDVFGHDD